MTALSFLRSLHSSLRGGLSPVLGRPSELQVAALCRRMTPTGPEVLLLSSLGTGRWILPKGWPMNGRSLAEAALIEAWEEAGVLGEVGPDPVGSYRYDKIRGGGLPVPCTVLVFPVVDVTLTETFPEAGRRKRVWTTSSRASTLVDEVELRDLFAAI